MLLRISMKLNSIIQSLFKSSNKDQVISGVPETNPSKFNFKLYIFLSFLLLAGVGYFNSLVDPLWYRTGNRLTKKNFFYFDERTLKTNIFLATKNKNKYNCLILGSSRVNGLKASQFKNNKCFNYSVKAGPY